jgi:transposase InsO family protein
VRSATIGKSVGATSHLTTRPYRLRTNGKAERFIQTALREWLYGKPYLSSAHRATDMPAWLHWYNHHRPHYLAHAGYVPSNREAL